MDNPLNIDAYFDRSWEAYWVARQALDSSQPTAAQAGMLAQWNALDTELNDGYASLVRWTDAYDTARGLVFMNPYQRPSALGIAPAFAWPLAAVGIAAVVAAYNVFTGVTKAVKQSFGLDVTGDDEPGAIERTVTKVAFIIAAGFIATKFLPMLSKGRS